MLELKEAFEKVGIKSGSDLKKENDWDTRFGKLAKAIMSTRKSCVALPWRLYFKAVERGWINEFDEKTIVKSHECCFISRSLGELLLESFKDLYIPSYKMPEECFSFNRFKGYDSVYVDPRVFAYEAHMPDPETLILEEV